MAVLGIPTNINGVAYSHADIVLNLFGSPVIGVTEISYSDTQTMESNYGTGHKPISVGFGAIEFTGSITLTMEEVEKLTQAAPGGRLQNIPFFDVGVNFITEDGKLARHRLIQCRFKQRNVSSSQGTQNLTESIELHVSDIEYNA
jgi:hypothetical protein